MHPSLVDIPWLGVLASTVTLSILGGLWFGAAIARHYAVALARPDIIGNRPSTLALAGPFACGAVISLANAAMLQATGVTSPAQALVVGLLVAVGYLLPMVVTIAINPNMPRPLYYSAINAPYFVVGNVLSCAIIHALG